MDNVYLFIVIVLLFLAVTDLIIGVSNDAVNFLSSALGAKAASFRNVMIIATIGVICGSIFSSGMMEIARKGIFNPGYFTMEEIMFLFATVMLTDIILLDFYNSIALPTSTTVSIVFELLGAALAISFFSVLRKEESITTWGEYINASSALTIITGIFISVAVAFIVGWLVQYIARLIVSFDYEKTMRSFGATFGALSVALITGFILKKGLTGIPGISDEVLASIKTNNLYISLGALVLAFLIFQVMITRNKRFNIYRFIVLIGTFALAMAFASNDLVNFVGVPIAGFESFAAWRNSGVPADEYMMTSLAQPVRSNPAFLLASGIIMALTLWLSKKARSVVKTTVNLGRQEEGQERFQGNDLARGVVQGVAALSAMIARLVPSATWNKINDRFVDDTNRHKDLLPSDRPAFDMVRAAVNLIVAAALILVATSLKLPLSTTFVTFMVLMGTSLADKAWAKGSAVYRVAGVLSVIGGWFLTAIIAMTVSIIFGSLLINFRLPALIVLVIVAALLIFKSYIFYRSTRYKAEVNLAMADKWFQSDFIEIEHEVREKLIFIMKRLDQAYMDTIEALLNNDLKDLKRLHVLVKDVEATNHLYKFKLTQQIKDVPPEYQEGSKALLYLHDLQEQLMEDIGTIIRASKIHVENLHPDLIPEQRKMMLSSKRELRRYMDEIILQLEQDNISEEDYLKFRKARNHIIKVLDKAISGQIAWATNHKLSGKNSELVLTILTEDKNMILELSNIVKLFYNLKAGNYKNLIGKVLTEKG